MSDDNRAGLSRLMSEQLEMSQMGPEELVRQLPAVSPRSVYLWLSGRGAPLVRNRAAIEDALGWKRGSVTEVLEAPITRDITLSEVRDWGQVEEASVKRAAELSDDELLAEVSRRWVMKQARLNELERIVGGSPAKTHQDMFGLAAHSTDAGMNSEHLENGV